MPSPIWSTRAKREQKKQVFFCSPALWWTFFRSQAWIAVVCSLSEMAINVELRERPRVVSCCCQLPGIDCRRGSSENFVKGAFLQSSQNQEPQRWRFTDPAWKRGKIFPRPVDPGTVLRWWKSGLNTSSDRVLYMIPCCLPSLYSSLVLWEFFR